ncbi:DUF397 domain-containing protein [Streptomyces sp. NPDC127119]|uniref:DUF397 domain-containing protein n=1 Tax=Streptomyces sp. NPDC127119 TaxID=3345370 RepID=UPI0036383792
MGLDGAQVRWRKSSASGSSECVEVAFIGDVAVRDSRHPDGAVLEVTAYAWVSFLVGLNGAQGILNSGS